MRFCFPAFVLGLGLHILGVALTIILLLAAERLHAFVEVEDDMLLLSTSKGDMLLNRPSQAVIFLDKHTGVSVLRGTLLALLGAGITTIILILLYWQLTASLTGFMEAFATWTPAPQF